MARRGGARHARVTSLARLGGGNGAVEQHLLRNFRRYARGEAVPEDTVWNWLAVGKHHGLPTRLRDSSRSPHVALLGVAEALLPAAGLTPEF